MNKRLVALGALLSLTATGALADSQHYATAPTKKEAKRLATADARAAARNSASCYHPARQVDACTPVDGGFRCRAETSSRYRTCRRAGWVGEFVKDDTARLYDPWGLSVRSRYWPVSSSTQMVSTTLYGRYVQPDPGPPAPPSYPPPLN